MKVKEFLKTKDWKYKRIRIVKITNADWDERILEGKTGIATYPFGELEGVMGVFLDQKIGIDYEVCNLFPDDEIEEVEK